MHDVTQNGFCLYIFYDKTVTVTDKKLHSLTLFAEESCSVAGLSEKIGFQLRSELSATAVR